MHIFPAELSFAPPLEIVQPAGHTNGVNAIPRNLKETLRWIKCGRYAEHAMSDRENLRPPPKESIESGTVAVRAPRRIDCSSLREGVWLWISVSVAQALWPVRSICSAVELAHSQEW